MPQPSKTGCDLLVNLTNLPPLNAAALKSAGVTIKLAMQPDRYAILDYIEKTFSKTWRGECEAVLGRCPAGCFIAEKEHRIIGFACYDSTAKGYFGPLGVSEEARGMGVGGALTLRCLYAMREMGYGYAVIGWVGDALPFYQKVLPQLWQIPDGQPQNSVYSNMLSF